MTDPAQSRVPGEAVMQAAVDHLLASTTTDRPKCENALHAHGTWGLGEMADRVCVEYRAAVEWDRRHA